MKHLRLLLVMILFGFLGGCVSLAPAYDRPKPAVSAHWRHNAAASRETQGSADSKDPGSISWRDFFKDEKLRKVIALSLRHNQDLKTAILDIEKARAEYRIRGAELFPSVAVEGSETASRTPASVSGGSSATVSHQYSVGLGFSSYELDLFGRIRSLKKEALESYLSQVETQRGTRLTLVAEVATDWLTLASDRQLLALAKDTLESQRKTLDLTSLRHQHGVSSGLDLSAVEATVESARSDVAFYQAQIEKDRNALDLVAGASVPGNLLPSVNLQSDVVLLAPVPADMKSSVLLRRPDVVAAEHQLKAANADIGAARAGFFPSISLTASAGRSSDQLSNLFDTKNRSWSFEPTINIPIFEGGSLRASLQESKVMRSIELANYQSTIQTAFREVADALAVRATLRQRLDAQRAMVRAYAHSYKLTDAIYKNGAGSYLDALEYQRSWYSGKQGLISLQLTELTNRVTLYKVLGGGADAFADGAEKENSPARSSASTGG